MKIGFLSMPLTGHLHPMTALGRKAQARGHEVIFFGLPDAARIVHTAGLDFVPFAEEEYSVGTTPAMYGRLAMLLIATEPGGAVLVRQERQSFGREEQVKFRQPNLNSGSDCVRTRRPVVLAIVAFGGAKGVPPLEQIAPPSQKFPDELKRNR